MRKYLYVIVRCDGSTLPLDDVHRGKDLATLLQQGWQPLRESPMGGSGDDGAWSLLLLAKGGLSDSERDGFLSP
jgi:hypothetical protein